MVKEEIAMVVKDKMVVREENRWLRKQVVKEEVALAESVVFKRKLEEGAAHIKQSKALT